MLWICSIASILSGCAGLKKFPTDQLWELDLKAQVCGQYQITDFENFKFKHVQDVPLAQCPAIFGFKDSDIAKVLDWSQAAIAYSKQHCK